ncbi:MAG: hypothetical protein Q8J85_07140 [Sulfuricurvum sp.]|nr:hypothetical protein [Sulfuricurvum sp.]MDP3022999.1 hypothetical protein [Sulfuricurvum sp.]
MKKLLGQEIEEVVVSLEDNNLVLKCFIHCVEEVKVIQLTIETKDNGSVNLESTFEPDMKVKHIHKEVEKWINKYQNKLEFLSALIKLSEHKTLITDFKSVESLSDEYGIITIIEDLDEKLVEADIFNHMNNLFNVVELTEENLEEMVG